MSHHGVDVVSGGDGCDAGFLPALGSCRVLMQKHAPGLHLTHVQPASKAEVCSGFFHVLLDLLRRNLAELQPLVEGAPGYTWRTSNEPTMSPSVNELFGKALVLSKVPWKPVGATGAHVHGAASVCVHITLAVCHLYHVSLPICFHDAAGAMAFEAAYIARRDDGLNPENLENIL